MRAYLVVLVALAGMACGGGSPPTAPTPTAPPPPPAPVDLQASIAAAFDAMVPASGACSISVSQQGQVVLERGRGQLAPGVQASGDSLYRIASLTKPITASSVLISEGAGRLSRSDKINRFVPFPEPAPTIDELIKHVPGLNDYISTPAYQTGSVSPTTLDALLALIQPWDGIKRYQYSNSHAILSGAALQQVNGMRYEDVVQRDIFGPAGMSQSSFTIPPASAALPSTPVHPSWVFAAGGITSSAADMNRFNQALLSNRFGFGAVESFDRSVGVTSFGMGSSVSNGDLRFTHTGLLDGYGSFSVIFPADQSSVVILCNFPSIALLNFVLGPGGIRSLMLAAK